MGRLATNIAAVAADADNMPSTEKLPSVSLIDALLPRRLASIGSPFSKEKVSSASFGIFEACNDPNVGRKTYVTYYDVRKSKNGSKSIVAHKSASPSGASGNGKGGRKSAQEGGTQTEFTAEEDAKLKELKDTNTTWADIASQMNRPIQELKPRWGQIKPNTNDQKPQQQGKGNGKGKQNQQNNNQQEKKGGKPQTKEQEQAAAKKREERQKRREEAEKPVSLAPAATPAPANPKKPTNESIKPLPGALPTNTANAGDETRFTLHEWLTLQSDSLFTLSELQCLSEIIMRDQNQTWLRIASVFYDKTGRKVHPEDIREKFEQMAGMG
ncbi:hypothetical protein KC356_g7159 [Hortaea werneckii]|nr:hypothetical protein KC356_g7159 [Hortaea werneckii]